MANKRKEPTTHRAFRVNYEMIAFFKTLKNANKFFIDTIKETDEYKKFLSTPSNKTSAFISESGSHNKKNQGPNLFDFSYSAN